MAPVAETGIQRDGQILKPCRDVAFAAENAPDLARIRPFNIEYRVRNSEERREAARRLGLGRKNVESAPQAEAAAEVPSPVAEVESEPAPARKRTTRAKVPAPSDPRSRRTRKEARPAEQAVESVE
ncbi:hypothetical protein [Pseudochelatococcus sp.]|uniref:hypothetical protein n=1 Tax=Pseudochelatococcus sp. TaxID=2020869 RepID=UPI003D8B4609